jgi:two-component system sensor kinase FixL
MATAASRLKALLDAAVDAIVLADRRGRIMQFNNAAQRLLGYTETELFGKPLGILMPEPYRSDHDGFIDHYQRTGEARIIGTGRELVARRKDGSLVPVELSVGEFEGAAGAGYVGILRDISERLRQREVVEDQSRQLQTIFQHAPSAVLITDQGGRILRVNRACAGLLGLGESLTGLRQTDLLFPDDREAAREAFQSLGPDNPTVRMDLRYLRQDGGVVHTTTQVALGGGSPLLVISEIIDRTPLLNAEREVEDLRSRLTHAARIGTLGEMVSGIAHEVNQPLTAIATYASACRRLMQSGQTSPEEVLATLEKISGQAERAGQVIRGLRNLTRRQDTRRESLDVNQLISEVAKLIDFELRNSGWRLLLRLASTLPPVSGDGVQLQQVLLNLIRNGIEAMRERATGDYVEVRTRFAKPNAVEIEVRDCGPGISDTTAAHLFEPFYTTKTQGMGLGLSICQSIVASFGGELSQRNLELGGASFTVRLPAAED